MIAPLNKKYRWLILFVFSVLFLVFIPILVFYAIGYRIDKNFEITPTGGVYVYYPDAGINVSINDSAPEKTTIFTKSIFIQNLKPSSYNIKVEKTGYITWNKTVNVSEKKVAEAYPFLIPQVIATSSIPLDIKSKVVQLFNSTTSPSVIVQKNAKLASTTVATTTEKLVEIRKDISLYTDKNTVLAKWTGDIDSVPFYFCLPKDACEEKLEVIDSKETLGEVAFFPNRNDVVLFQTPEGIFVTEFDKRSPQNILPIVLGSKLDFRVDGSVLYIKDKNNYYSILLQ